MNDNGAPLKNMQFDIVPGEKPGEYVATMTPLDIPDPNPEDMVHLRVCWDFGRLEPATKEQMQQTAAAIVAAYDKEKNNMSDSITVPKGLASLVAFWIISQDLEDEDTNAINEHKEAIAAIEERRTHSATNCSILEADIRELIGELPEEERAAVIAEFDLEELFEVGTGGEKEEP